MIVDASILAKTFLEEADSDDVRALFLLLRARGESLLSPELVKYELGSVALRISRKGKIPPFNEAIGLVDTLALDSSLLKGSLDVASSTGLSFYDGCYIALAENENCLLWTADGKLLKKRPDDTVTTEDLVSSVEYGE